MRHKSAAGCDGGLLLRRNDAKEQDAAAIGFQCRGIARGVCNREIRSISDEENPVEVEAPALRRSVFRFHTDGLDPSVRSSFSFRSGFPGPEVAAERRQAERMGVSFRNTRSHDKDE